MATIKDVARETGLGIGKWSCTRFADEYAEVFLEGGVLSMRLSGGACALHLRKE